MMDVMAWLTSDMDVVVVAMCAWKSWMVPKFMFNIS
jgi:hypothetical protein